MNMFLADSGLPVIKEIVSPAGIAKSAAILAESFQTVADDFGLTPENCPTHPAFIQTFHLNELKQRGWRLFGLFHSNKQVGFMAIGPLKNGSCSLEKLAVLPAFRHHGYGRALVYFALDLAGQMKAIRMDITIIDENRILKDWYQDLGFNETELKKFAHLPFTVCFMRYRLE